MDILLCPPQKIAFVRLSVCLSVRPCVCQRFVSGLYLEHLLTNFLQTLYRKFISGRSGLRLNMGKFRQTNTELLPLIYVKIPFLAHLFTNFLLTLNRSSYRKEWFRVEGTRVISSNAS